jgi:ABC-2 type transport system permease protein
MYEVINCTRAFFIRDAQNTLSYRFDFLYSQVASVARTLALWLPAQLVGDNPLFKSHGGFLAYSVTGSAMMGLFMASYGGFASAISSERGVGTLEAVFATRAPLGALLMGGSSWALVRSLFDVALNLTAGMLLFGIEWRGSVLGLMLVVLLTNLTFVAFGFLSAAFTIVYKRGDPFRLFVGAASALFGGVFFPVEVLPKMISWVGELLPITHGARALRGIALEGHSVSAHWFELVVLAGFSCVLLPFGWWTFYKAVSLAKQDGTLFHY